MDDVQDEGASPDPVLAQHLWALERGLSGAQEALDAYHRRRRGKPVSTRSTREHARSEGTDAAARIPETNEGHPSEVTAHDADARSGEKSDQPL
jgi:hypothetical protein